VHDGGSRPGYLPGRLLHEVRTAEADRAAPSCPGRSCFADAGRAASVRRDVLACINGTPYAALAAHNAVRVSLAAYTR
jgi:hypothetical protein